MMEYEYARIDLSKTNYKVLPENQFRILSQWNYDELMQIFSKYCAYKNPNKTEKLSANPRKSCGCVLGV